MRLGWEGGRLSRSENGSPVRRAKSRSPFLPSPLPPFSEFSKRQRIFDSWLYLEGVCPASASAPAPAPASSKLFWSAYVLFLKYRAVFCFIAATGMSFSENWI